MVVTRRVRDQRHDSSDLWTQRWGGSTMQASCCQTRVNAKYPPARHPMKRSPKVNFRNASSRCYLSSSSYLFSRFVAAPCAPSSPSPGQSAPLTKHRPPFRTCLASPPPPPAAPSWSPLPTPTSLKPPLRRRPHSRLSPHGHDPARQRACPVPWRPASLKRSVSIPDSERRTARKLGRSRWH
jgi:hypothetical protein